MIPTIETIAEDLAAGRISIAQAIAWLHQHAEGSANELRDHFAGLAMQGLVAAGKYSVGMGEPPESKQYAEKAYRQADAMMIARAE